MKSLIISARSGWGKTALLKDFYFSAVRNGFSCGGFWAFKKIEGKNRLYFSFLPSCEKEIFLAEVSDSGIFFSDSSFEKVRKAALKDFESDFFIMDEIGPLEFMGRGHSALIEDIKKSYSGFLLASSRPALAERAANLIRAQKVFDKPSREELFSWTGLK